MKRGSSLRFIECPMPPTCGLVLGAFIASLPGQPLGRVPDRLHDVDVPGAATEVAGDGLANLRLARVRISREERAAGHHHAGRAVAALEPVLLPEALLHRMELAVPLQSLDRLHLVAVGLDREEGTGFDRHAVEQDGTRPAVGGVAADVRTGQAQRLAQEVNEQQSRLDLRLMRLAVDLHLDRVDRHDYPLARSTARPRARTAITRAISRLYSTEPRRSALGVAACAARRAASASLAPSGCLPVRCRSAATAWTGAGPTLVSASPTRSIAPFAASVTCAA